MAEISGPGLCLGPVSRRIEFCPIAACVGQGRPGPLLLGNRGSSGRRASAASDGSHTSKQVSPSALQSNIPKEHFTWKGRRPEERRWGSFPEESLNCSRGCPFRDSGWEKGKGTVGLQSRLKQHRANAPSLRKGGVEKAFRKTKRASRRKMD